MCGNKCLSSMPLLHSYFKKNSTASLSLLFPPKLFLTVFFFSLSMASSELINCYSIYHIVIIVMHLSIFEKRNMSFIPKPKPMFAALDSKCARNH